LKYLCIFIQSYFETINDYPLLKLDRTSYERKSASLS